MKKALFGLILLVLLAIPILVLIVTGRQELTAYQEPKRIEWKQTNYGELFESRIGTIYKEISVKGSYVASKTELISYPKEATEKTVLPLSVGSEIQTNDVIAITSKREIKAKAPGVIRDIQDLGDRLVFHMDRVDNPYLELLLPLDTDVAVGDELIDENEQKLSVVHLSSVIADGKRKVTFRPEDEHLLGEPFSGFIRVGEPSEGAILIEKSCIYQKEPNGPYFVQTSTPEGLLMEEVEIQVGVKSAELANVIGLDSGVLCDSGYAQLMIPLGGGGDRGESTVNP